MALTEQQPDPFVGTEKDPIDFPDKPSTLEDVYRKTIDFEPDYAAQVVDLAKKYEQPQSFVAHNLDAVKKDASIPPREFFKDIEDRHPITSRFLSDPQNMAVAKDDIENLGYLESLIKDSTDQMRKSMLMVRIADLDRQQREDERLTGKPSNKFESQIKVLENEMAGVPSEIQGGFFSKMVGYSTGQIPNMAYVFSKGVKPGLQASVVATGATALIAPPLAPAAMVAGYAAGTIGGLARGSSELEGAMAYRQFIAIKGPNGQPIPRDIARRYADRVGAVNGLLEAAGDAVVFGMTGRAALRLAETVAKDSPVVMKILGKISGKPEIFAKMSVRQAVAAAGKMLLMEELAENLTEQAQNIGPSIGAEFLQSSANNRPLAWANLFPSMDETYQTALQTSYGVLPFALFGGGSEVMSAMGEIQQAQRSQEIYKQAEQLAAHSKLKARSPETFEAHLADVAKGSPMENIYISAPAFETYFQSQGIDAVQAATDLGAADQFKAALAKGETFKVSNAVWLNRLSETPHSSAFINDFTYEPEGLTKNEAELVKKESIAKVEETIAENEKNHPENKTQVETVKKHLYDGLVAAGRGTGEAKVQSEFAANLVRVEAANQNVSVSDFWNRYPIQMENGNMIRMTNPAEPGFQLNKAVAVQLGVPEGLITENAPILWSKSGVPVDYHAAGEVISQLSPQRIAGLKKRYDISDKKIKARAETIKASDEDNRTQLQQREPEIMKEILSSKIKFVKGGNYYQEFMDLDLPWYERKQVSTQESTASGIDSFADRHNVSEDDIIELIKKHFSLEEKSVRRNSRVKAVESNIGTAHDELVAEAFFDDVKEARAKLPKGFTEQDDTELFTRQMKPTEGPLFQEAMSDKVVVNEKNMDGKKFLSVFDVWGTANKKPADSGRAGNSNTSIALEGENVKGEIPKNLIATHNLSAAKLKHADKIGGLAVPSLAINRTEHPNESFGEITLIGNRDMVDPGKSASTKVFNSDAYSQRYPTVKYFLDTKKTKDKYGPMLDKAKEYFKGNTDIMPEWQSWHWSSLGSDVEDRGILGLERDRQVRALFAMENGFSKKGTGEHLDKFIKDNSDKYTAFYEKIGNDIVTDEKIFKGFTDMGNRKYKAHTLENVVKELKGVVQDVEGFNYGLGSLRAVVSKRYRTITQIMDDRNKIISDADFELAKKIVDKEFTEILDEAAKNYEHKDRKSFRTLDTFLSVLKDGIKSGNIEGELKQYGFPGMDVNRIKAFLQTIRDMPTEYFEAKLQRAVYLNEFSGAVIPSTAPQYVRDILTKHGIKIATYSDKTKRAETIRNFSDELNKTNNILFQSSVSADPFYYNLQRVIEQKMPNSASVEQIRGIIGNGAVKQDEIEWSGIEEFLADKKTVTREELISFLKSNEVKVEEVVKGGREIKPSEEMTDYLKFKGMAVGEIRDVAHAPGGGEWWMSISSKAEVDASLLEPRTDEWNRLWRIAEEANRYAEGLDSEGTTKHATKFNRPNLVLPGGENYRELLLTLQSPGTSNFELRKSGSGFIVWDKANNEKVSTTLNEETATVEMNRMNNDMGLFHSTHFTEPNILAHVRFNERTDASGNRVLFIEEVQSDWGQGLRKSLGIRNVSKQESVRKMAENVFGSELSSSMSLEIMDGGMLALGKHNEIRQGIVSLLPIDMVDKFGGKEAAVKNLFDNPAMVGSRLSADTRLAMASRILNASRQIGTDLRTKLLSGLSTGRDIELFPTLHASDLTGREIVGMFSPQSIYHVDLSGTSSKFDVTGSGTEKSTTSDLTRVNAERFPATTTEFLNTSISTEKGTKTGRMRTAPLNKKGFTASIAEALNWHNKIILETGVSRQVDYGVGKDLPLMPFEKSWLDLSLKRMLRYAVDNNFDSIAWTTGEQQAERYDLSKQLQSIAYIKSKDGSYDITGIINGMNSEWQSIGRNIPEGKLSEYVGKELAQKMIIGDGKKITNGEKMFTGVDLKVGGEGMKGFYDQMIPSFLNKYTKKWGGKVGETEIDTGAESSESTDDLKQKMEEAYYDGRTDEGDRLKERIRSIRDVITVHSLSITPEMRESVSSGQPLFQDPADPRGFIEFMPEAARIVFTSPNASTFIHEIAHYFLREKLQHVRSGKASPEYIRDFNVLAGWLDITNDQKKLTTKQQEKFARGFELYLRGEDSMVKAVGSGFGVFGANGEMIKKFKKAKDAKAFVSNLVDYAPTFEMKKWFKHFRRWLTRIYPSASQIGVEMSDPVRGVMSRMLASEAEIEYAQRANGDAVQTKVNVDGADPTIIGDIEALREKAHEAAVSQVLKRQMLEMTVESDDKLRELRREATAKATEEVGSHPIYKAMAFLEKTFSSSAFLVAREFEEKILRGRKHGDVGLFELTASVNGFSSGAELAATIIKTPDMKSEIDARVATEMEKHVDMRDSIEIKEESMRAVLSEHAEEILALEQAEYIDLAQTARESARGATSPAPAVEAKSDALQRIRSFAKLSMETIQRKAAELMAERPVGTADDYLPYITSSRNAAVNFNRALERAVKIKTAMKNVTDPEKLAKMNTDYAKQLEKAADLKEKQMLNHALARQAFKNKAEIEKTLKSFRRFQNRGADLLDMPYGFIRHIDILLARFGVMEKREEEIPALMEMASKMISDGLTADEIANETGLVENGRTWKQETLIELEGRVVNNFYTPEFPTSMIGDKTMNFKDMPLGEFRDLKATVTALYEIGRNYDGFLSEQIKVGIRKAAIEIRQSIEQNVGMPNAVNMLPFHKTHKELASLKEKIETMVAIPGQAMMESLVTLPTICRYLDGGKENGPMFKYVYSVLKRAEDHKFAMVAKATSELKNLMEKHFTTEELANLPEERISVASLNRDITREELLTIGLNWGNEGNRRRVMDGYGLNRADVQTILSNMTKKEWDFCQGVWDYLDTFWPQIKAIEMKVAGLEPHQVSPAAVVTKFGTYRGGYYPIVFDPKKSVEAYRNAEQRTALYKQSSAVKAHTDHGFTSSRVAKVSRAVLPSLSVLFGHVDNVIHDLAFRESVVDINRLIRNFDFKTAVVNAVGIEGYRNIEKTLNSVASDQGEFMTKMDKCIRWFRYNVTFATLAYRIKYFAMDVIGNVLTSIWEVGPTRTGKAISDFAMAPGKTYAFVNLKSNRMRQRATIRERDLYDMNRKIGGKNSAFKQYGFIIQSLADQTISYPVWMNVYRRSLVENDEATAIDIADDVVTRTFGTGSILDQAPFQRGTETQKVFTMYFSWLSMMFNRWWLQNKIAGLEYDQKNYGKAAQIMVTAAFYVWIAQSINESLWRELVRNPDNDDPDKRMKRIINRTLQQPVSYVPVLRDVASYGIDKAMGLQSNIRVPLLSAAEAVIVAGVKAAKFVGTGFEEPEGIKVFDSVAKASAYLVGYPQMFNDVVFNFIDWLQDEGELTWKDILSKRTKN